MTGRPGRMAIPILAVAFALTVLSAGVAVARPGGSDAPAGAPYGGHASGQVDGHGDGPVAGPHGDGSSGDHHGQVDGQGHGGGNDGGSGSGSGSGGGGVSGSSSGGGTDTPSVPTATVPPVPVVPALPVTTPVVAQVAAPLQPEVDAVVVNAAVPDAVADAPAAAALPDLSGLAALTPPPAAEAPAGLLPIERGVLSTPAARSLAAVLALALAVLLFLAMQGLFDRGEPKLAGVRDGRDVARFR